MKTSLPRLAIIAFILFSCMAAKLNAQAPNFWFTPQYATVGVPVSITFNAVDAVGPTTINWGDGMWTTAPINTGGTIAHTYTTPGHRFAVVWNNGYSSLDREYHTIWVTSPGLDNCYINASWHSTNVRAGTPFTSSCSPNGGPVNLITLSFAGLTDTASGGAFSLLVPENTPPGVYPAIMTAYTQDTACISTLDITVLPPLNTTVNMTVTPSTVSVGQSTSLYYTISQGYGQTTINWGDGTFATMYGYSNTLTHSYNAPGSYTILITNHNGQNSRVVTVTGQSTQPFTINSPAGGETFTAAATDTLVTTSPVSTNLFYTIVDANNAVLASGIAAAPVSSNGTTHKYLITWPEVVEPTARVIASVYDSILGSGRDTSNVFSITGRKVKGLVFFDFNSNGTKEVNEPPFTTPVFTISPNNANQTINGQGNYTLDGFAANTYTYSVANAPANTTVVPAQYTDDFTNPAIYINRNFALQPIDTIYDLGVFVTHSQISTATVGYIRIYVRNNGPMPSAATTVTYTFNPAQMQLNSTVPATLSQTANTVTFSVPALQPGVNYVAVLNVVMTMPANTATTEQATIVPPANEVNVANNSWSLTFIVPGAVDPNDITATPDTIYTPNNVNPPELNYVINFQNTGNGPAVNIHIVDTIAADLEMATFEILESTHAMSYLIMPNHVIDFVFNNIMLPDSNVNEPGSHGQIVYRIKPLANLPVGTIINSAVDIYFDYNPTVRTNTSSVYIVNPTIPDGVAEQATTQFNIYPNPANGLVFIQPNTSYQNEKLTLRIFAADGRLVYSENYTTGNTPHAINTAAFAKGLYSVQISNGKVQSSQKVVVN